MLLNVAPYSPAPEFLDLATARIARGGRGRRHFASARLYDSSVAANRSATGSAATQMTGIAFYSDPPDHTIPARRLARRTPMRQLTGASLASYLRKAVTADSLTSVKSFTGAYRKLAVIAGDFDVDVVWSAAVEHRVDRVTMIDPIYWLSESEDDGRSETVGLIKAYERLLSSTAGSSIWGGRESRRLSENDLQAIWSNVIEHVGRITTTTSLRELVRVIYAQLTKLLVDVLASKDSTWVLSNQVRNTTRERVQSFDLWTGNPPPHRAVRESHKGRSQLGIIIISMGRTYEAVRGFAFRSCFSRRGSPARPEARRSTGPHHHAVARHGDDMERRRCDRRRQGRPVHQAGISVRRTRGGDEMVRHVLVAFERRRHGDRPRTEVIAVWR
jgi:hypothetical protein